MSSILEVVETRLGTDQSPKWKSTAGAASAVALSFLFLASGIWKLTDIDATAERMVQSLMPVALSVPVALAVAICETFAGVLLLIPRYRRWGSGIAGLMLIVFMIYIGALYGRLTGEDCNCFPWIRRVVGPAFFAGDAAMLALAGLAAWCSRKSQGWRRAALVFCCVCLAAGGSYAVSAIRRSHADAPETATVDGRLFQLRQGRVLLYFFDPQCSTCFAVAHEMLKHEWDKTRIVILPTREPRYARAFLNDSGIRAGISPDAESLRKIFPFTDPPYAVALARGKATATFNSGQMEGGAYYETLTRLGYLN